MYTLQYSLHSCSCLELRQLRSDTSFELGCDARGHSRAGNNTTIWYCVVVAGRSGAALSKKRQVSSKSKLGLLSPFKCCFGHQHGH
jgi:hypothetical protein